MDGGKKRAARRGAARMRCSVASGAAELRFLLWEAKDDFSHEWGHCEACSRSMRPNPSAWRSPANRRLGAVRKRARRCFAPL